MLPPRCASATLLRRLIPNCLSISIILSPAVQLAIAGQSEESNFDWEHLFKSRIVKEECLLVGIDVNLESASTLRESVVWSNVTGGSLERVQDFVGSLTSCVTLLTQATALQEGDTLKIEQMSKKILVQELMILTSSLQEAYFALQSTKQLQIKVSIASQIGGRLMD